MITKQRLITGILFFLPFLFLPVSGFAFEQPKVIFFLVLTLILLLSHGFTQKNWQSTKIFRITCAWLAFLTLVTLMFHPTTMSIFGNQFRMQGIILLWCLVILAYLSHSVTWKYPNRYLVPILLCLELLTSLFILGSGTDRAIGTIGEPNALAAFALFLYPFTFFKDKNNAISPRWMQLSCALVAFCIIFLSGSRSGLIGFVVESAFLFLTLRFSVKLGCIAALLLIASSLFLPFVEHQTKSENRSDIWQTAFIAGTKHPFLGYGIGNTETGMKMGQYLHYTEISKTPIDSSHNLFLDWWLQGGIIGFVGIATLCVLTIRVLLLQKNIRDLTVFLGILTAALFNPLSITALLPFWWIIGNIFVPFRSE